MRQLFQLESEVRDVLLKFPGSSVTTTYDECTDEFKLSASLSMLLILLSLYRMQCIYSKN